MSRSLTIAFVVALTLAGCGANSAAPPGSSSASATSATSPSISATAAPASAPTVTLKPGASTHGTQADGDFRLDLDLSKLVFRADESIIGKATLTNTSAKPISIYGSGAGPFAFNYAEVGGNRKVEGAWPADCGPIQTVAPFGPMSTVLTMSGSYQPDDPKDAWKQLLFTKRFLPAGVWEVVALANFSDGNMCNGRGYMLQASVRIQVTSEGPPPCRRPRSPTAPRHSPAPARSSSCAIRRLRRASS